MTADIDFNWPVCT